MGRPRTINQEMVPELIARHKNGATLKELVGWLAEQGCKTGIETVRAELARCGQAAQVPRTFVVPEAEPETIEERRRILRYEVAQEKRRAQLVCDADPKRYHSALRLSFELLKFDARPQPTKPAEVPAQEQPPAPSDHVVFN